MDVSLSELQELVMDREAWRSVIHGVTKSRTRLSNWTELNWTEDHSENWVEIVSERSSIHILFNNNLFNIKTDKNFQLSQVS